jgi:lysozyme family protein
VILEQIDSSVLKLGSKGPQVSELQKKIGLTPDGDFGPATDKAVKALQTKLGITPDGIVGPETLAKIAGGAKTTNKSTAFKVGKVTKEVLITIGKTVITIIMAPIGITILIGQALYKLAQLAANAIVSLLTSLAKITNQIIIKPAIALTKATGDLLVRLGAGIWKGLVFVATGFGKLLDKTADVLTKIMSAIWSAGKWVFLKALTMAKQIPEIFSRIGSWIDTKGQQVAKLLGKTWDFVVDAFKTGKSAVINAAKQALATGKKIGDFIQSGINATVNTAKNVAKSVYTGAKDVAKGVYNGVADFAKGFMSEGYVDHLIVNEHFNYYSKLNTATLIKESSR